jgi:hypothetical protein
MPVTLNPCKLIFLNYENYLIKILFKLQIQNWNWIQILIYLSLKNEGLVEVVSR